MTGPVLPVCPACGRTARRAGARFCGGCGAPLPAGRTSGPTGPAAWSPPPAAAGGDTPAEVRPAPPGLSRPARRRLLVVGGGLVLLLVAGLVYYGLQNRLYTPQQPIHALFDALARRNGSAAAELLGLDGRTDPLATDRALSHGYRPPTDLHIGTVHYGQPDEQTQRPNKGLARVQVSYRIAGHRHSQTMRLERASSGWIRRWSIVDGGTRSIRLDGRHVDQVRIGGVSVATADDTRTGYGVIGGGAAIGPLAALPGRWMLRLPDGADRGLFTMEATPLDVVGSAASTTAGSWGQPAESAHVVRLPVTVRPTVVAAVRRRVHDHIDGCSASHSLAPDGCPFADDAAWTYPEPSVTWTIDRRPEVTVVPVDDPAGRDDHALAVVQTTTTGRATAHYDSDGHAVADTVDIDVGGAVAMHDGDPSWSP